MTKKFVFMDEVREILEMGKAGKKNVILWGSPGHAKSEFVTEWIKENYNPKDVFMLQFHSGMTEEKLFGGVHLKFLEETGQIRYNLNKSFMNSKVVVFEEFLDAPPQVLLALKDVLTRKAFVDGNFQYPIKTEFIIGITNKSPSEIAELGEHVKAIIERFPLQLNVKWPKYDKKAWEKFFDTIVPDLEEKENIKFDSQIFSYLAKKLDEVWAAGEKTPSPRSVVYALQSLIAKAKSKNADMVSYDHLDALLYVLDFDFLKDEIKSFLQTIKEEGKEKEFLKDIIHKIKVIRENFEEVTPDSISKKIKLYNIVLERLSEQKIKHQKNDKEELQQELIRDITDLKERLVSYYVKNKDTTKEEEELGFRPC